MIAYFSDHNRPLEGVPSHLLNRRINELVDSWQSTWNIRCLGVTPQGECTIDITQASKAAVFQFLESVGAVCVDLEPSDIVTFAGRSVASLAAMDLMRADPAVRAGCMRLTPEEILSTVDELIRLALQASQQNRDASDAYINEFPGDFRHVVQHDRDQADQAAMERLKQLGFDVPPEPVWNTPAPENLEVGNDFTSGDRRVVVDPFAYFED